MTIQQFWEKNKVIIMGAISAVSVALYGFLGQPITDWLAVGYAAFVALGSYAVRNARGQWLTIIGAVLGAGATIYTGLHDNHSIDFGQLLMTIAINLGLAASGPVKPLTYEKNKEIVEAEKVPPVEQKVNQSPNTLLK